MVLLQMLDELEKSSDYRGPEALLACQEAIDNISKGNAGNQDKFDDAGWALEQSLVQD